MKSLFSCASLALMSVMTLAACTHSSSSTPSPTEFTFGGGSKPSPGTRAGDVLPNGKCSPQVIADYKTANASCQDAESFSQINKCQEALETFAQAHPNVTCNGVAPDGTNYSISTSNSAGSQASSGPVSAPIAPSDDTNICKPSFVSGYDRIQAECSTDDIEDMAISQLRSCENDARAFWDENEDVKCVRPDDRSSISASDITDAGDKAEFELYQRGE